MIRGTISRHPFGVAVAALTVGIIVVAGFLLAVALPDVGGLTALVNPAPTASPAPTATPQPTAASGMALSPIAIQMPVDANCEACHVTTAGTVGTKPIPKLGHPLWGFQDCTACHKPDGLVQTAPGHSSLHKNDCLICHQVPDPATTPTAGGSVAPMRPEHMGGNQPCTSCHGVDKHAPLPPDMAGRDNCWICHNGPEFVYLFESPSPGASPAGSPAASPSAAPGGASTGSTWALVTP
ncbi:MAG TPA: hypothetical protein VIK13_09055 [Candidatus Limnocylindrales bacterium]